MVTGARYGPVDYEHGNGARYPVHGMLVVLQSALIPSGTPERVWAIGDLHGDVGCALHWVERTGLLRNASLPAAEWEWTEPSSQLVFLGDYIDRGPDSKAVLTLVRELTLRFPEHVHALLGNHELNLLLDRARSPSGGRYLEYAYAAAHPAQYEAWLPEGERTEDLDGVLRSLHDALLSVYRRGLHAQGVPMAPDGPSQGPCRSLLGAFLQACRWCPTARPRSSSSCAPRPRARALQTPSAVGSVHTCAA